MKDVPRWLAVKKMKLNAPPHIFGDPIVQSVLTKYQVTDWPTPEMIEGEFKWKKEKSG